MNLPKRVAVVGAGASGLVAIKCLKEEGLEPVCFEKANYIGGLWKYHNEDVEDVPSVPNYTFMDHSKEMWCFSDFPPKKELPNFMKHTEVHEYLVDFANHFELMEHVFLQKEVTSVVKSGDFEASGRWTVTTMDSVSQEEIEEVFDGVLVCSGHLSLPHIPKFRGIDEFQGKIIHTHSLKKVNEFDDKLVLVIGSGSSGLDAAVEISNVAKKVYLSARSGAWVIPRLGLSGLPADTYLLRRWYNCLRYFTTEHLVSNYIDKHFLNPRFSHELYNLKPNQEVVHANTTINDSIALKVCSGAVIVKKQIKLFTENSVVFLDSDDNVEVDVVVLATGYEWKFPYLERGIIDVNGNRIDLYKNIFPPQLKHPTLALIGFINPIGPVFPVSEIQSRWVSRIMANKAKLPPKRQILMDIATRYSQNVKRFPKKRHVSLMADYLAYMEDMSSKIGARPNFFKMLFFDRKLFSACYFGPIVPYQYRLEGPNAWKLAREVILSIYNRITYPLHGKCIEKKPAKHNWSKSRIFFALNAMLVLYIAAILGLKRNRKLRTYLVIKLFPYINMLQQLVYG